VVTSTEASAGFTTLTATIQAFSIIRKIARTRLVPINSRSCHPAGPVDPHQKVTPLRTDGASGQVIADENQVSRFIKVTELAFTEAATSVQSVSGHPAPGGRKDSRRRLGGRNGMNHNFPMVVEIDAATTSPTVQGSPIALCRRCPQARIFITTRKGGIGRVRR